MSRQTFTLSAAAIIATAGFSFTSADGAEAIAQEAAANAQAQGEIEQVPVETVEIVPTQPEFIAQEVVQDTPEPILVAETSTNASSLGELVANYDTSAELTEQMHCLAGAVYFESRGEPLDGQLAVAQVIINRADDHRWPASYCGVVYQRAQFSFVRGGRMPSINTRSSAWHRAKAVAQIAHNEMWDSDAGEAVYFHATHVRPRWSRSKTRVTQIDTHIFYR